MKLKDKARLRYGALPAALLAAALAVLLLVNLAAQRLERQNGWRIDCSFNAVTTQSEATRQILAELPAPVHIYALFPRGEEDGPLMELLDRYAAASPLVTWERSDLSLNPLLATRYGSATVPVTSNSLIVTCEKTGRFRVLDPSDFISLSFNYEEGSYEVAGLTYESEITSALVYVTRETIPRIRILQGHSELDSETLSPLFDLLARNHYAVEELNLLTEPDGLSEGDLLMVLSPLRDLTAGELSSIEAFAQNGGSLFFTCDYADDLSAMPNYTALLRSYGFLPKEGIVVASGEEAGTCYEDIPVFLLPAMQSTDATLPLLEAGEDTLLLPGARAFETPADSDRSLTVLPVLTSGYKAYLRPVKEAELSLSQGDDDEIGPFTLALQATRITNAGYVSKAFVLGCSTVLTDTQVQAMTDSQAFLITMVQHLIGGEVPDLGILPKTAVRPQLSARAMNLGLFLIVLLPLLPLAAALLILLPRRRR